MKRTAWLRKALWITPLVLLLLVGAGLLALRSYLSSGRAAQQVAERLQDMLGGRVEVQSAHIGLIGDSTVRGIQAFADGEQDNPWLRIDDVETDVSALSLLRDRSPDAIQLQGARITLRFDADGHLLTKLPSGKKGAPAQLPRLHIAGGQLTLNQEHHAPMLIRGIDADITPGDNRMTLSGTIHDPFWGDWKAQGGVDTAIGKSAITLDTDDVDVTMEKLKAIAFVPPSVWNEVRVEGRTPAEVKLNLYTGGEKPDVQYRVQIAPRDAHVQVPSIDLDATHASGKAVIADEIVQLDNVRGQTAGGFISTDGKLNFRDEPTRLAFKVGVRDVLLHDLPRSWKVPRSVNGKLTGSADLVLVITQGKVETSGSGGGLIRDASWNGFPITKPVRLSLHSENGRFHFKQAEPASLTEDRPRPAVVRREDKLVARREAVVEESEAVGDGDLIQHVPTEMVNLLGRGIKWTADGLAKGIDAAASGLGKLKPPSKPDEEPTYLNVDLSLQDVDLTQLVKKLGLNLPYPITGRLTFSVHASIPVNTAGDLKAYRLNGTAKLPRFAIDGLAMTDVEAKVRYADGVLDLQSLHGKMPPPARPAAEKGAADARKAGTFDGDARVQVVPRGDLQASLKVQDIPLATLLSVAPGVGDQVKGILSGTVQARAPLEKLGDPASWRGTASVNAPRVDAYGFPVRDITASLIVKEARAQLSNFKASVDGTPLTGEGELQLKGNYPFKAEVHLGRTDLAALNRLSPSFRPPVEIKGRVQLNGTVTGTLMPFHFDTTGRIEARDLVAEGLKVDDLSFRLAKDKNGLNLNDIKADLYGGTVAGSAVVPLDADTIGRANLAVSNLDVQALAKSLPSFPIRLEGKVSGTVKGELAAEKGQARTWTTDIELTAPRLRVQGIPAEKLKGSIDSRGGKTSYNLRGETLGGTFTLKGNLPASRKREKKPDDGPVGQGGPELLPLGAVEMAAQQPAADESVGGGRLELRNARLSRLWQAYNITGGLAHLGGRFALIVNYRHSEADFFPVGNGTFRIVNISWDNEPLGEALQGSVRLTANTLELYDVSGDVAGGQFRGLFAFGLKPNSRSWFQIELQQAEASRLLVPLPAVAPNVKGPVDLNLRGRIGQEWDGSGGASLVRGQIYGMEVTEWRIPLTFSFSPSQGNGELAIRDSAARVAQGRASFEATMNWGNGLRLTGRLLFYQVDLRTLLRHSPAVAAYASGRVSGRVDLSGSEMRSANDLRALVQARMEQGQALQLPVLRQITPYLRPGVSNARFQSGTLKGRLAGGIFRIEHATLVGDFLKLLIQGTITLAGNLDLDVTAQTGLYCLNPAQTNRVTSRIPIIGAIPRLLLYEASSLLAASVVQLDVTGTVRSPIIRVKPLLVLTETAVRFFLGRLTGVDVPNLP